MNVRLVDCVGYLVKSALGYMEGEYPEWSIRHGLKINSLQGGRNRYKEGMQHSTMQLH